MSSRRLAAAGAAAAGLYPQGATADAEVASTEATSALADERASGRLPEDGPMAFHEGTELRLLAELRAREPMGPDAVLATVDDFCWHRHWMMNIGDVKGSILDEVLQSRVAAALGDPAAIRHFRALELGTYVGYSAVRIARLLPPGGKLYTVDVDPRWQVVAKEVVHLAGLANVVEFLQLSAESATKQLKRDGVHLDFVLIDHSKPDYLPALLRLERAGLMRPGCLIVADNVLVFQMSEYVEHVRASGRYRSAFVESSLEYTPLLSSGADRGRCEVPDGLEVSLYEPRSGNAMNTSMSVAKLGRSGDAGL